MTSLEEVARRAGVSTATVSRALSGRGRLSDATRHRVRQAASDLGYVVSATASSLATGRTRSVGILVPLLGRWFFSNVLDGIATALTRHGYDITLYNVTDDAEQRRHLLQTSLRRGRVDAVIVLSLDFSDGEIDELEALGLPLVGLGTPSSRLSSLRVDDVAVARVATEHLLRLGHRDIAHVGQSREGEDDLDIPTLRRRGFEAALREAHVAPAGFASGDFTIEAGYRAAGELLRDSHPTAIFAASDELAFGALFAARDAGLAVPRDISVVGVDGHELGGFFGLTTVEQFPHAQGERVAEAVLAALGEDVSAPAPDLPFALVERASTASPR
jgi:DNA-binding LacI/PurR family transcriptional regulator